MEMKSENFDEFRTDMKKVFEIMGKKYGMNISLGAISYSTEGYFTAKMTAKNSSVNGVSFDQNNWNKNAKLYDLKPEWFNRQITVNNKFFTIVGLEMSRKNPIAIRDSKGKNYTTSVKAVQQFFENLIEL